MSYFGIYRGFVVNNVDPELQSRITVLVPAVTGNTPTAWARPGGAPRLDTVLPSPGSLVWVMFEGGAVDSPVWFDAGRPYTGSDDVDVADLEVNNLLVNTSGRYYGSQKFFTETHFGAQSYVDPDPGVVRDIKAGANGIATTSLLTTGGAHFLARTGDSIVRIESDPTNDNVSGEDWNPTLYFHQDARGVNARIGLMKAGNAFEVMQEYTGPLHLGTSNTTRMTISTDGNTSFTGAVSAAGTLSSASYGWIGPYAPTNNVTGRMHLGGNTAELSLGDRTTASFVENPTTGQRWVDYVTSGVRRWWSGADRMTLTAAGDVSFTGTLTGGTVPWARLSGVPSSSLIGNWGQQDAHTAYQTTGFDGPSNFGGRFIQTTVGGPGIPGATQYYNFGLSLGSEYPYTSYAMQWAVPRTPLGGTPHLSFRFRENGTWGTWQRVAAGNADTVTDGVYLSGAQTVTGLKTFTGGMYSTSSVADGASLSDAWPTGLSQQNSSVTNWPDGASTVFTVRNSTNRTFQFVVPKFSQPFFFRSDGDGDGRTFSAWSTVATLQHAQTFTGAKTFSGATTFSGTATFGTTTFPSGFVVGSPTNSAVHATTYAPSGDISSTYLSEGAPRWAMRTNYVGGGGTTTLVFTASPGASTLEQVGMGIGSSASRQMSFYTSNGTALTERMRVASDGRVTAYNSLTVAAGTMDFGNRTGQLVNFWGTTYAAGISSSTLYMRTAEHFAIHRGGTHSDTIIEPGTGGNRMFTANSAGTYTSALRVSVDAANNNKAHLAAPLTPSAAEFELTAQSMVTIGESAAGSANPVIRLYRTYGGYRQGTGWQISHPSSSGPLEFGYGATTNNSTDSPSYGSETYTTRFSLSNVGALTTSGGYTAGGDMRINKQNPTLVLAHDNTMGSNPLLQLTAHGTNNTATVQLGNTTLVNNTASGTALAINAAGGVNVSNELIVGGSVTSRNRVRARATDTLNTATSGWVELVPGNSSNTGYVEFFKIDGARHSFIGWSGSTAGLIYNSATGHAFEGAVGVTGTLTSSSTATATAFLASVDGTAAAPAFRFGSASNTGMYSPTTDQIALATGGVTRLTLTSTAATHALASTFSSTVSVSGALSGTGFSSMSQQLRANVTMTGGGTLSVSSAGAVKWTTRIIVISNGRGSHFSTSGYFDINMPAAATVITGVAGAANATVTADGVPLGAWQALYYILPIGSGNGSLNANFRVVGYGSDLEVPDDWVLIAQRNDDASIVRWGVGVTLDFGGALDMARGTGRNQFVTLTDTQTVSGAKTFTGTVTVPDSSFNVSKLSATGTRSASTFLRGDNTWATVDLSPYFQKAGDSISGIATMTRATAGGAGINRPGTGYRGAVHFQPSAAVNGEQVGITFAGGTTDAGAQAGILSSSDAASGTRLNFYTTESYATGLQRSMSISNTGNVLIGRDASLATDATTRLEVRGAVWITAATQTGTSGNLGNQGLRFGGKGQLVSHEPAGAEAVLLNQNLYFDGTNWRQTETSTAGGAVLRVSNNSGDALALFTAPSVAAGAVATLTKRFGVDPSGNITSPTVNDLAALALMVVV